MSYVLTVVHNGVLEHVDLFAGIQRATEAALLWANAFVSKLELIDTTPESVQVGNSQVWTFVDTNKTNVSVRFLGHSENLYSSPKGPPAYKLVQAALPPPPKPAPVVPDLSSPTDRDDPLADHLPGGWSHPERKPLSVKDLKDGVDAALLYELSKDQMWALAIARVSKRPKVLFLINPNMYPTCNRPRLYSQKYALEELRNKTSAGAIIRDMELAHLHPWLGDGEESQDPQAYDYSSSDSFDHY